MPFLSKYRNKFENVNFLEFHSYFFQKMYSIRILKVDFLDCIASNFRSSSNKQELFQFFIGFYAIKKMNSNFCFDVLIKLSKKTFLFKLCSRNSVSSGSFGDKFCHIRILCSFQNFNQSFYYEDYSIK